MSSNSASSVNLDKLTTLNASNCKMRNRERVEKMLDVIIAGGADQLQLITDFDYTVTKQKTENDEPILSSFGMFKLSKSLPKEYLRDAAKLYDKYRPIELNPNIPHDEKFKFAKEWYELSSDLLKGFPYDQTELDEIISEHGAPLRDRTDDLFKGLNDLNVPVLVFSAGLGDTILYVLKHANILYPNVHVISNFIQYKDGLVNGFASNENVIIHPCNKNENALKGAAYYESVHGRKNVILMGDSLGDASMADGAAADSTVLKIGFLFDHQEEYLPKYLDTFDIVLIDDQTMNLPLQICQLIGDFAK